MRQKVVRCSRLLLAVLWAGCAGSIDGASAPAGSSQPDPTGPASSPTPPGPVSPPPGQPMVTPPARPPTIDGPTADAPMAGGFVRHYALSWEQYDHAVSALVGRAVSPSRELSFPPAEPSSFGWLHQSAEFDPDVVTIERMHDAAAKVAAELARAVAPCAVTDAVCVETFVRTWGRKIWRRPLAAAEVTALQAAYLKAARDPALGPAEAPLMLLEYLLRSHHFFMRSELGDGRVTKGLVRLTGHEIASALSFALWNRPPDAELMAAADDGRLQDAAGARAQAARLLAHPNAAGAFYTFVSQWLGFHAVASLAKDVAAFPSFQPERTGAAMEAETRAFVAEVVKMPTLGNLLNAAVSFPPKELAWVYGTPTTGQRLETPNRKGLLMQPSYLASHASLGETSPTARGLVVVKKLACFEPPPPDPDAVGLNPAPDPTKTTRERFAAHAKSPACAACHTFFDPIGLAFEIFDAAGRHRTSENGKRIDPSGQLAGGVLGDAPVPFRDVNDVVAALGDSDVVRDCVVRQAFAFFQGREVAAGDAPLLARARDAFARSGLDFKQLIIELTTADEALLRRVAVTGEGP